MHRISPIIYNLPILNSYFRSVFQLPAHLAICAGCGLRHRVRLVRKAAAETAAADAVFLLRLPYVYAVPGVLRDFRDEAAVLVDLRPGRASLCRVPGELIVLCCLFTLRNCRPNICEKRSEPKATVNQKVPSVFSGLLTNFLTFFDLPKWNVGFQ